MCVVGSQQEGRQLSPIVCGRCVLEEEEEEAEEDLRGCIFATVKTRPRPIKKQSSAPLPMLRNTLKIAAMLDGRRQHCLWLVELVAARGGGGTGGGEATMLNGT